MWVLLLSVDIWCWICGFWASDRGFESGCSPLTSIIRTGINLLCLWLTVLSNIGKTHLRFCVAEEPERIISYFQTTDSYKSQSSLFEFLKSTDSHRVWRRTITTYCHAMMRTPRNLNKPAVPPIAATRVSKTASTCDKASKQHSAFTASAVAKEKVSIHLDIAFCVKVSAGKRFC